MSYSSKFLELVEPNCELWICLSVCVAGEGALLVDCYNNFNRI